MRKVELLAPAGNFEKLEIAIHYGADAVYLAGKNFSLRNFSGNFSTEELRNAMALAHEHGIRVYVACNIYARNHEQDAIAEYLRTLGEISPDALIVADPGILAEAREILPDIPLHLSTQANTTNYKTALFWQKLGVRRINTARELSLTEIREISQRTDMETEAFVHGAMCISYSGRCLLSSFMAQRDSNRGMCCHPCRFRYTVMEAQRPGEYYPIAEDGRGAYIFNSRDLCMIEHIPEMIASGITSLKIEGRMKGINYLASVVRTYREAIDAYYENPETYSVRKEWAEELGKISNRGYCTGFYFGDTEQVRPDYSGCHSPAGHNFLGKVLGTDKENRVVINVRNKILKGDSVEIIGIKGPATADTIHEIWDEKGCPLPLAQPNSTVSILLKNARCSPNDLIRKGLNPRNQRG